MLPACRSPTHVARASNFLDSTIRSSYAFWKAKPHLFQSGRGILPNFVSCNLFLKDDDFTIMAGLLVVRVIAVILLVLCFSAAAFIAVEIPAPDDSGQTYQNDAASLTLVSHRLSPPPCKDVAPFLHEERPTLYQSSAIFRHLYRGPPTLL